MENEYASGSAVPVNNLLGIGIEGDTRSKLQTIVTWSKITSIGGFVNLCLSLISAVYTLKFLSGSTSAGWLIGTQLVSLAISFFLNYFLWQFSKNLKTSLDSENQESFVQAAVQLKSYMRMLGILLIATIVLGIASSFLIAAFPGFS